jgi:hypothetical protein
MSWSVQLTGKGAKVAEALRKNIAAGSQCAEPEESVRRETLEAAAKCAESLPNTVVVVNANGSMWRDPGKVINHSVSMNVSVVGNFIE